MDYFNTAAKRTEQSLKSIAQSGRLGVIMKKGIQKFGSDFPQKFFGVLTALQTTGHLDCNLHPLISQYKYLLTNGYFDDMPMKKRAENHSVDIRPTGLESIAEDENEEILDKQDKPLQPILAVSCFEEQSIVSINQKLHHSGPEDYPHKKLLYGSSDRVQ